MKIELLEQRHPDYDADGRLCTLEALYEGGAAFRKHIEKLLPAHSEEMGEAYAERLRLALYTNHFAPIVNMLSGALFAEPAAPEQLPKGEWWSEFLKNVDRNSTTFAAFAVQAVSDALVYRRAYAWVNLPRRPEGLEVTDRAQQEAAGLLDAYVSPIRAQQVIDWETDEQGRPLWLMVRDCVETRPGVEAKRVKVHRWTRIDTTSITIWEWTPPSAGEKRDPGPEDEAELKTQVAHRFGRLPVAVLTLPTTLHAGGYLHDPAIAHCRGRNDLSFALHRAAHALLYIKQQVQGPGRPILGPGYYVNLGPNDDIGYAEPSGSNFQLLSEDVVQRREEMFRVVHQMAVGADSDATRARGSGESKQQDWKALEIVLVSLADRVRPFLADVLKLVGKARGETVAPTIAGLDGWQQEALEAWLAAAAMATDARRMSPTFTKSVAKMQAQRVLGNAKPEVLKAIEKEIDEAPDDEPQPFIAPPPPGQEQP